MDFTELQYSTLMCALNAFDNIGEYGTTHLLSTVISDCFDFIFVELPPSIVLRRRYNGIHLLLFNLHSCYKLLQFQQFNFFIIYFQTFLSMEYIFKQIA